MDGLRSRLITPHLKEVLADTPVVVVQGPRQCGKSTLVQNHCPLPYVTLDDQLALDAAERTPASFLKSHESGFIIDEIQRAPKLARSIKALVDSNRKAGSFVLTGSANILVLPKLADSLAGRMEVISLWPFTQGEINGESEDFVSAVLNNQLPSTDQPNQDYQQILERGGYPEPVERSSEKRRRAWFESYLKAIIERDIRDLADIEGLNAMPRLLRVLAKDPYSVTNITAISRDTGIPATSLTRYLSLLEKVFLTVSIPAYTALSHGKAAKTSRVAFADSGILTSLQASPAENLLANLENFVAMELVKQATWSQTSYTVQHFRSVRQFSVPIVLALPGNEIIGISIIDREIAEADDFRALQFLSEVAEPNFKKGFIFTLGTKSQSYNEQLSAEPLSRLWSHT